MGQYRTEIGTAEVCDMLLPAGRHGKLQGVLLHRLCSAALCPAAGPAPAGHQMALSGCSEAVWDKLEGGGAEHPDRDHRGVGAESCHAGGTGPPVRCFSAPARRSSCPSCPAASCASRGRDRCRAEKEHKKRQSGPGSASRSAAPPVLFWPVPSHDPGRGRRRSGGEEVQITPFSRHAEISSGVKPRDW